MKTCETCGNELSYQKKFCSRKCRDEAATKVISKVCVICGNTFDVRQWELNHGRTGLYCGVECSTVGRRGIARPATHKRMTRNCVVCGKEFITGGRAGDISKQFCSTECRSVGRYRKGAEANSISEIDAAYIAGFVDGEGSIMITERDEIITTKISISNTKPAVLEWICELFGVGRIGVQHRTNSKHATSYFWACGGDSAKTVLQQIRPYLKLKQVQADLAIEAQLRLKEPALKADRIWQMEYRERMKLLNKRGG